MPPNLKTRFLLITLFVFLLACSIGKYELRISESNSEPSKIEPTSLATEAATVQTEAVVTTPTLSEPTSSPTLEPTFTPEPTKNVPAPTPEKEAIDPAKAVFVCGGDRDDKCGFNIITPAGLQESWYLGWKQVRPRWDENFEAIRFVNSEGIGRVDPASGEITWDWQVPGYIKELPIQKVDEIPWEYRPDYLEVAYVQNRDVFSVKTTPGAEPTRWTMLGVSDNIVGWFDNDTLLVSGEQGYLVRRTGELMTFEGVSPILQDRMGRILAFSAYNEQIHGETGYYLGTNGLESSLDLLLAVRSSQGEAYPIGGEYGAQASPQLPFIIVPDSGSDLVVTSLHQLGWTPNGKYYVTFDSQSEYFFATDQNFTTKSIKLPFGLSKAEFAPAVGNPVSDKSWVVFFIREEGEKIGTEGIYLLDIDKGIVQRITENVSDYGSYFYNDSYSPFWPREDVVVYVLAEGDKIGTWLQPVSGGEAQRLFGFRADDVTATPDGKLVIVANNTLWLYDGSGNPQAIGQEGRFGDHEYLRWPRNLEKVVSNPVVTLTQETAALTPTSVPTPGPVSGSLAREWSIKTGEIELLGVAQDGKIYGLIPWYNQKSTQESTYVVISPMGEVLTTQTNGANFDGIAGECLTNGYIDQTFNVMADGTIVCAESGIMNITPNGEYNRFSLNQLFLDPYRLGDDTILYLNEDVADEDDHDHLQVYRYDGHGTLLASAHLELPGTNYEVGAYNVVWQTPSGRILLISKETGEVLVYDENFKPIYRGIPKDLEKKEDKSYGIWYRLSAWGEVWLQYPLFDQLGNEQEQRLVRIDTKGNLTIETKYPYPDDFRYSHLYGLGYMFNENGDLVFFDQEGQTKGIYSANDLQLNPVGETFIGHDGKFYNFDRESQTLFKYVFSPEMTIQAVSENQANSTPSDSDVVFLTNPNSSPTPPPVSVTSTPVLVSQDCVSNPGSIFVDLWQKYRPILGCPVSNQVTVPTIAEEVFQGGQLFWRNDTDEVYVIYDRQKEGSELFEGNWQTDPTWKWDGSNPDGISLSAPPGLVEPKRGFGWLWRTHLGGENGPLGWAIDKEYGHDNTGQAQIFEQGVMFKGSTVKVYILLSDGRFFAQ